MAPKQLKLTSLLPKLDTNAPIELRAGITSVRVVPEVEAARTEHEKAHADERIAKLAEADAEAGKAIIEQATAPGHQPVGRPSNAKPSLASLLRCLTGEPLPVPEPAPTPKNKNKRAKVAPVRGNYEKRSDEIKWIVCQEIDKCGGNIQTAIDQLAAEMEVTFKKPVAHTTASNWYKRWLATDHKAFNGNTVCNTWSVSLPLAIYAFVKQWILELIDTGSQVNSATLRPYITAELKCKGYGFLLADAPGGAGMFKVSRSWIRKVCRQMNLSHRTATSAAQKLPDQWEQVAYLTWKHKIPPQLVINGDQTGCNMFPASRNTYARIGTRHVWALGLEDKWQITVMVACSALWSVASHLLYQLDAVVCTTGFLKVTSISAASWSMAVWICRCEGKRDNIRHALHGSSRCAPVNSGPLTDVATALVDFLADNPLDLIAALFVVATHRRHLSPLVLVLRSRCRLRDGKRFAGQTAQQRREGRLGIAGPANWLVSRSHGLLNDGLAGLSVRFSKLCNPLIGMCLLMLSPCSLNLRHHSNAGNACPELNGSIGVELG
ncbi:hypothetical protein VOLCADRAFT_94427 [Volvox carteri f. nagariensis]|uniref:HTH CENPB-type domain-containing protein n=1 Tax=Volvox carteri f. nagariensis TaxID=3068 RepID=D8U4S3_VOLCA|nr:uncharacterized protein VOLCADRAFT_94427 [Volvox carteri f. nagariensis]EFJ45323.1 hypothetical protein VOLCADRAFT_94427 [Volvox carteri f. nagariensis]|eukprot:XP_002953699.1 hypothetical protein VOLCADRAFT_94427 [Volvox carteri f. nagariensis]